MIPIILFILAFACMALAGFASQRGLAAWQADRLDEAVKWRRDTRIALLTCGALVLLAARSM